MHPTRLGLINGLAGMLIFSASLPATRVAVQEFEPVFLTLARASIAAWTAQTALANVRSPLDVDVTVAGWPGGFGPRLQGIVCINLLHIAPWAACVGLMAGAGALLEPGAPLYLYGPFKRGDRHTAPSNAQFDRYLRAYDPDWGVRDMEAVVACAADHDLDLVDTVPMPANNLSVILRRR